MRSRAIPVIEIDGRRVGPGQPFYMDLVQDREWREQRSRSGRLLGNGQGSKRVAKVMVKASKI